ncbi:hypothetical protein D3C84_1292080 [compost metagenome]
MELVYEYSERFYAYRIVDRGGDHRDSGDVCVAGLLEVSGEGQGHRWPGGDFGAEDTI